jgi:hypothetical protein
MDRVSGSNDDYFVWRALSSPYILSFAQLVLLRQNLKSFRQRAHRTREQPVASEPPFVLAIDVGKPANIGWASASASGTCADLPEAVDRLCGRLAADRRAAIGFEAPIWTPRRMELSTFNGARNGETMAWSAGPGASVLASGLGLMSWTFARIAQAASDAKATVSVERWRERGGLLIWEAFVSGAAKGTAHVNLHIADAIVALDTFMSRWPDLRTDIAAEPALNLAVAAAMSAGLTVEPDEIGAAAVVFVAATVAAEQKRP